MTEEEENLLPKEPTPPLTKAYIQRDVHPVKGQHASHDSILHKHHEEFSAHEDPSEYWKYT